MDSLAGIDLRNDLGVKKSRIKYSVKQVARLESVFNTSRYPDTSTLEDLALEMGVPVERISIWFQNRRSKLKRKRQGDHVTWMRQQIFQVGSGTYDVPVLPVTSEARHVLSPVVSKTFGTGSEHNQRISSSSQVATTAPTDAFPNPTTPARTFPLETTPFDHTLPYQGQSGYFRSIQHVPNSSHRVPNSSHHVPNSSRLVLDNSTSTPPYCMPSVEHSGKENSVQYRTNKMVNDKTDLLHTLRVPLLSLTNTIAYSDCRYQRFDIKSCETDWETRNSDVRTNVPSAMIGTTSVTCIPQRREDLLEQYPTDSVLDQALFSDSDNQVLDCLQQWD